MEKTIIDAQNSKIKKQTKRYYITFTEQFN